MTFAELFNAVDQLLPDRSYSIDIEAWHHRHMDGTNVKTVEFSIWDGTQHHVGATPEAALRALKEYMGSSNPMLIAEVQAVTDDALRITESA